MYVCNVIYVCLCMYVCTKVGSFHSKKNESTSDKDNPANIVHNASSHSNGDKNAYLGISESSFYSICMYVCKHAICSKPKVYVCMGSRKCFGQ